MDGTPLKALAVGLLLALGPISSARAVCAPPPNDDFPGISLAGSPALTVGTNVDATAQAGEPDPAGSSGTTSVWWTWTPSVTGRYGINTSGSNFDTTLGVYTGAAVNSLSLVAENDDGSGGLTSQLSIDASAGTAYRVQVNGFLGDTGAVSLNILGPVSATVSWTNPPPSTVAAGSQFSVSWSVSGATSYTDLLIDTVNPPDPSSGGVPQSGGAGTYTEPLTAPPFGSTFYFQAHAIIGGVDFYSTVLQVTIPAPPPPANDTFPGIELVGATASTTGTNIGGTAQPGEPNPAGVSGTTSVWWFWTCPLSGTASISLATSNYDTTLGVYTGTDVAALVLVAQNDDGPSDFTSQLTFSAVSGVTYRIQVNGYNGGAGSISLALNGQGPPSAGGRDNDNCGLLGLDALLSLLLVGAVARRIRAR